MYIWKTLQDEQYEIMIFDYSRTCSDVQFQNEVTLFPYDSQI